MPGLSQLKKFSSDLLALGDEVQLRAARGEQPVKIEIPKDIQDVDDSEDFVLGMPEIEAEVPQEEVDDDLSDLAALANPDGEKSDIDEENPAPTFEAPDMSSLLNPMEEGNFDGSEMPDLSMFADEPVEEEQEVVEEEPEEISIADMGLDALLSGSGFDEPKESEDELSENFDFDQNKIEDEPAEIEPVGIYNDLNDIDDLEEIPDLEEPVTDIDENNFTEPESFTEPAVFDEQEKIEEPEEIESLEEIEPLEEIEELEEPEEIEEIENVEDLEEPDSLDEPDVVEEPENFDIPVEEFELPENLSEDKDTKHEDSVPEFSDLNLDDLNLPEDDKQSNIEDFDLPDLDLDLDSSKKSDELSSNIPEVEFNADDDIPDYDDLSTLSEDNLSDETEKDDSNLEPLEIFDTSEMDGIDFGIPDTDSQLSNIDDDSAFDVPRDDGLNTEFEIPGFSDVETVKEQKTNVKLAKGKDKKQKQKRIPVSQISKEENIEDLPPNTLTDKQYEIFRKNLDEYPLNVRLAFENFMVQDEFTDDAEFEVIEKILNKAPARQVASTLEKMLDISIPVPRDFEHRSAEEYEAYKKSVSYQLKNKIIPAILLGIVGIFICIGLFNFSKNCIYKPIKARNLYKQGYVLLQETEYPLSESKFNEAAKYRLSKKWFYKYARGYREHKQYQRAGQMYQNILYCFKHDKNAGLEYADMELNDLVNYARAEEIIKREVLDYHINDADGILKLGDVYLEWGTEKDPSKFELAREQYASLLQLYGESDLYLSRMMRYFIRTDNLREVLQLKQTFEPREKSLCADDWTELSGYLLDKYYGELSPSEEYLRYQIEGLRKLLLRAVQSNPQNPVALYNLSRYFINTNEYEFIETTLQDSIEKFNSAKKLKSRDLYKYIDAYRLLGEHYINTDNYLQAQEQFAEGISLYITERDNAGFEGTPEIGRLYEDMGNIKYTISGDYDDALLNYTQSVNLGNDSPKIRYRIGYIQYNKKNYSEALGSFMKTGDGNVKERNLLLAMANTLALRGDDYAAEGYYNQLIENLDSELANREILLPQAKLKDADIVTTYLYAANNYGVTLYKLAQKTGDSSKNAQAIVQFSQSVRAWDALTRNPETMVRLEGSNLAEQNIKYVTHPIPEFEPSIYTGISKTLLDNEKL